MASQPHPGDVEAFRSFCDEFRAESDRAAVILGAAKLDQLLSQVLQRFLVPVAGNRDDLLDNDAPLSTFSSRINAVHRLGLITPEFARALHLVRKVRNAFAHEVASGSFESGAHRDRIREVITPFVGHSGFVDIRRLFFEDEDALGVNFRCALAIMTVRLLGLYDHLTPVEDQAQTLLAPDRKRDVEPARARDGEGDSDGKTTESVPPKLSARGRRRAKNGDRLPSSNTADV